MSALCIIKHGQYMLVYNMNKVHNSTLNLCVLHPIFVSFIEREGITFIAFNFTTETYYQYLVT